MLLARVLVSACGFGIILALWAQLTPHAMILWSWTWWRWCRARWRWCRATTRLRALQHYLLAVVTRGVTLTEVNDITRLEGGTSLKVKLDTCERAMCVALQ